MPARLTPFGKLVRTLRRERHVLYEYCTEATGLSVGEQLDMEFGLTNLRHSNVERLIAALNFNHLDEEEYVPLDTEQVRLLRHTAMETPLLGGLDMLMRHIEHLGLGTVGFLEKLRAETGLDCDRMVEHASTPSDRSERLTRTMASVVENKYGHVLDHLLEQGPVIGLAFVDGKHFLHLSRPLGSFFGHALQAVIQNGEVPMRELAHGSLTTGTIIGLMNSSIKPTGEHLSNIHQAFEGKGAPLDTDAKLMLFDYAKL